MFGFLCFLHTTANDVAEVLFRNAFVSLAIIRTDTRAATDKLINQAIVYRIARDFLGKPNDRLAKLSGTFFQVERMLVRSVPMRRLVQK